MKYRTLKIENFRGITNLKITDMKRINLLVGRNNCGKTSILEAAFLLSGMSNPKLPVNIHSFRNLILNSDEDFSFMFRNLDFSIPIVFKGDLEGDKERTLNITPVYADSSIEQLSVNEKEAVYGKTEISHATTSVEHRVEGINLQFQYGSAVFNSFISIKEGKVLIAKPYKEYLSCSFLNEKTLMTHMEMNNRIEGLLIQKKLESLISVLKGIEPLIADIRMGGTSGIIYVDLGKEKLFPVNIEGDGMRRILALLAAISSVKDGVLLIDEIENGLHYASLAVAWKAIFAACKEYDVQMIATTHSYECVEAFSKVYCDLEPEGDDIRLFRIDKGKSEHKAYPYNVLMLKAGIEKEFELR